jgi:hypothetical protein
MLRVKAGFLGTLCVVFGAATLFLEARHSLTGMQVPAVLVDRVEECTAEFQPKGESRRKEAMSCERAFAFRAAVGENKVRVHKTFFALLRLPMADGSQRAVKVDLATVNPYLTQLGSSVPVVYDPSKPDDVRLPLTFARVQGYLGLLGLGLLLLAIAFVGPILRAVLGAFSGRASSGVEPAAPELTRGQLALQSAREAQRERAGGTPQRRPAEARVAAAGGSRRSFGMRS